MMETMMRQLAPSSLSSSDTKLSHGSLNVSPSTNQDMNITYSSTARCKKTIPLHHHQQQQQQLHLPTMLALAIVVLLGLMQATVASPVFVDNPSLAQFQSGRNIRHLPCIVRKSGRSGVCMFAIDCIKQNGTHLGTCIDRFYFGSCCQMKEESPLYAPEIIDNSIDQNTISHFVHESTTLPTSTLFKLTTESLNEGHISSSHSGSELLKNLTQSYTSNKVDTTATTTSGKPIKEMPSKRPPSHTTHKTSQFVVRTTARPSSTPKTTVAPTTVKPTRRKTTTPAPILTTAPQLEQRIDTTTLPTKFFTFQIVETTTPTATEPTHTERQTTHRPFATSRRPKPTVDNLVTPNSTVATTSPVTTTNVTTTQTTPPIRITTKPKPIVTRRPVNTKKPSPSKRPVNKPTRKPVQNTTLETAKPDPVNSTTSPFRKPPVTTIQTNTQTTFTETKPSRAPTQTTRAPRPRPRPTAEIVRVPKPTLISTESTTTHSTSTTTTPAPTVTKKTSTPQATSSPSTVTKAKPKPSSTSTTTSPSVSTTTTSTTKRPKTTTTAAAATTTATSTTTSKSTTPTPDTTEAPKAGEIASITTTTLKPGLVTWTNLDAEPVTNATTDEDWRPRPPPSDWVPVPTIAPDTGTKVNLDAPSSTTEESTTASSTEKIIVSISSSISEIMNNASHTITKPEKPITTSKPITAAPITTKAPKPKPKPTESSSTSSTTTTTTTTTTSTTEAPIELDTSTNIDLTTDGVMGAGSTTMEYVTEDYNSTMGSTTPAPANSLEGVDYKQICGRRMFPEPRIVGGSNAAFGRWPWQISLRQWRTSTYLHKCGAALLNENWAITAAHCVDNVPPSDLLLRLGEYDLAEEQEPYGYQERRVQIVASHPQFDSRTFEYDLALLRFYEPIVFQPNIIPVCVPESDLDFIGQTAFVTGWGRLYEDGPLPSVLQEVAVPVINNTICESMYRSAGYIEHIPHIFICAGWKKGGYDSCEGDSGGPMVLQREEDKRFQLGGVISWGIGCAEANQPGVYTRISEFRDWINQILRF